MSGREEDIPLIEPEHDPELAASEYADMYAEFAALVSAEEMAKEKSNVVRLPLPELKPKHTDTELVPESPVDALYSKMCFDPEADLIAAANETWLIDDIIPARGLGFIYGPPASYKSFIAVDLAMCIATGKDWHGSECEMPGAVVYIAAEGSRGVKERVIGWRKKYNMTGSIVIMSTAVMMDDVIMRQAFTECVQRAREQLQVPIRMVVIDTMARSFSGDENSSQETGAFFKSCEMLAEDADDCFVMIITHTRKNDDEYRGSSAVKGAADCMFLVKRVDDRQALVKNTKQKDVEEAEPRRFALELIDLGIKDRKGRPRKSMIPVLESKGADADPDSDAGETTVFDHRDSVFLVGLVRAAEVEKRIITEDDLRKEFIREMIEGAGKKDAAAKRAWQRTYKRVREEGKIMKSGANIHIGSNK